ncbi:LptF/LptG family permease [Anaeroselena agilis]|uniref:LptF/LptG family permease n=1 Tax=Anaeroselena agilis TaxID=3063788 RepID=A0ABU3P3G5_9FIRM|nr:LptF/LptG family permease [Selenomonadales bacterium 4137-cl]
MLVIDRYLLTSLAKPLILSIAGLSLLFLSSAIFEMGTYLIVRRVHPYLVGLLLLYKLPSVLVATLPMGSLFAMLFVLGKMARDRELMIVRMSGLRTGRILLPYLAVAVLLSGLSHLLNEAVVVKVNGRAAEIVRRIIFDTPPPELMQNVFFADKDRRYYIGHIAPATKTLRGVMIFELKEGKMSRLITAEYGFAASEDWLLHNAVAYEFDPQGRLRYQAASAELTVTGARPGEHVFRVGKSADDMTSGELRRFIDDLRVKGIHTLSYEVDYHLKSAMSVTPLVFALFGAPLISRVKSHEKVYTALLCVTIVTGYYVIASLSAAAGRASLLPPLWAAWAPPVGFSLLGLALLRRADDV